MSTDDKFKNAAEETLGKAKETVGDVTNNKSLENEGRADQAKANIKQAGEKIKDSVKNVFDGDKE